MFRKVSTLLVLATCLALAGCDDEIITDAIPVADAASDHSSEASKEGGDPASDASHSDPADGEGGIAGDTDAPPG